MLRIDRQIKPGLVALYDIWPGNGMGLFLQLRSPHGVNSSFVGHVLLHYLKHSTGFDAMANPVNYRWCRTPSTQLE